jgi:glycerophosphoryl diester phosphodiesterase
VSLVIAHRGASADAVDNSLDAFERAIEAGADMIEFDVRRTAAGELVAFHDPVGERTREDLGAPLLSEVLELARGRIGVDVELKEDGYVAEVAAQLRDFDPGAVIVTSFLDAVLPQVARALPGVRTGLLFGVQRPPRWVRTRVGELNPVPRARAAGADLVAPNVRLARLGALQRAHAAGFPSLVWTVNDEPSLARLLHDPRVAGVITDVPAVALALRRG